MSRSKFPREIVAVAAIALGGVLGGTPLVFAGNPPPKPATPVVVADPPTTTNPLAPTFAPFTWGMNHADVAKQHNQTGGIFDNDYNPQLVKMQPGVKMQSLEAEREAKKDAFTKTWVEFKDTPTGYDQTAIKDEFTYRNKESIMYVDRNGRRRYFFFISDKLWKIYDEIPLGETGPLGKTFNDAATKLNTQFGVAGRIQAANAAQGRSSTTIDWQDSATHVRALDRSGTLGLVYEDRATLANIGVLRANKEEDPLAVDPSITAATRGVGRADPNASKPSGTNKTPPPKK